SVAVSGETYAEFREADWLKKRCSTAWICIVYALIIGMEYSCISTSLLYYLQDDLKLQNPKLYYSLIMCLSALSASVSALISGKLFDKTRRLKLFMLVFTLLTLVGNLLYTMHVSVWFLVVGRFLCGLCDAAQPIISGEFSRLYEGPELTKKLSQYQALYAIGFLSGPAAPVMFGKIDIKICSWWTLNQNNFVGIFMALLTLVILLAILLGVHDLSIQDVAANTQSEMPINTSQPPSNSSFNLKSILKNLDLMLLILSSSFTNALAGMLELMINLTASDWFKWSLTRLGIVTCICVVIYTVLMLTVAHKVIQRYLKFLFLLCFPIHALCVIILMLPKITNIDHLYSQEAHLALCILTNTFTGLTISVLSRNLLFQMVPAGSASFSDGFRSTTQRIMGIVTFFLAAWAYDTSVVTSPILSLVLLMIAIILATRRKFRPEVCGVNQEHRLLLDENDNL
uniref:Major facilitator superfamily (MFS) profile domain-containing protein n=2 Tax=Clytia hemisphaerica TaxID=252671 RepID=A0A7M5UCY7_9CNID